MLSVYGKLLRKIRIDNNELLNDMALKLDVSPALLSYIENDKREIPKDFTDKVVVAYGLSADDAGQLMAGELQVKKTVKVDLAPQVSFAKRETAMLFARTFNNMNDDVLAKIKELLEGSDGS